MAGHRAFSATKKVDLCPSIEDISSLSGAKGKQKTNTKPVRHQKEAFIFPGKKGTSRMPDSTLSTDFVQRLAFFLCCCMGRKICLAVS